MTSVILFPLITEKSSVLQATSNKYCFVVRKDANKLEIAQAVKSLKKGIEVESVNTQIIRGKVKRMGVSYGKR